MADGWIQNGPVSLPPRTLAYGAGALVLAMAVVGGGLGFDAAWRREAGPDITAGPANQPGDLIAKPIVEIAPPAPAPEESKDEDTADDQANDEAKADAQTAAAQASQGKASAGGDIDQIMASPTEKPPAPVKAPPEAPPPATAPVKSDVPF